MEKINALRVERESFDRKLLDNLSEDSRVINYYGLVEQVGVIYPFCGHGFRHPPRWANVLVRDVETLDVRHNGLRGLLQFMNVLAYGAPYYNVLTEDTGRLIEGNCPCGWSGPRFEPLGRLAKTDVSQRLCQRVIEYTTL